MESNTITEMIKEIAIYNTSYGCTGADIDSAEKTLNIRFPQLYKEYLMNFGYVDFGVHKWTGLNVKGIDNVVKATLKARKENKYFPSNCFVLENFSISSRKVIINESGEVYLIQYDLIEKQSNSLIDYLNICTKELKDDVKV
jgi:hypothetical protein